MPDRDSTAVAGVEARGYQRGPNATDGWDEYVIPVSDRIISFQGFASTFITPGRAAVGQKILSLHNAAASPVLVAVNRIRVDMLQTAAAVAIAVVPPVIRLVRFTPNPTGGTALAKTPQDSTQTSNASVVVTGDASADGTGSGTTLTLTATATLAQVWGPRLVQATATAGNSAVAELVDTAQFLYGEPDVILRAGEGVAIFLDQATVTTGNPATNRWIAQAYWEEFTRP
jgi:hypothetical protein